MIFVVVFFWLCYLTSEFASHNTYNIRVVRLAARGCCSFALYLYTFWWWWCCYCCCFVRIDWFNAFKLYVDSTTRRNVFFVSYVPNAFLSRSFFRLWLHLMLSRLYASCSDRTLALAVWLIAHHTLLYLF